MGSWEVICSRASEFKRERVIGGQAGLLWATNTGSTRSSEAFPCSPEYLDSTLASWREVAWSPQECAVS